jgi:hypothetical protein
MIRTLTTATKPEYTLESSGWSTVGSCAERIPLYALRFQFTKDELTAMKLQLQILLEFSSHLIYHLKSKIRSSTIFSPPSST